MGSFNRLLFAAVAITLLLLCGAPAFADVEVYMQPPTLNGILYASQNDVGGFGKFATVYDNFQIYSHTTPYYLDDVEWFGGYFNPGGPGTSPDGPFRFMPIMRGSPVGYSGRGISVLL